MHMADATPEASEFLIQVQLEGPGTRLEGAGDTAIKGAQKHLEAAGALARQAAETVGKAVKEAAPTSGAVEFSITFEGEAGLPVLAKGKAGATLTITLGWEGE
jgi:hypothetical protein